MRALFSIVLLLLLAFCGKAQEKTEVFTQEQLLWFVDNYHPVSKQGKILLSTGNSNLRKSKGGFDPYLHAKYDQKQFVGKEYYSILNTGLKIPTWYGIELQTGFDQNKGEYLNPENNVPTEGLWYAGLKVPLGQGMFLDKRRAALKQASIFTESTLAEQKKLMNDLYFDAIQQYWKWVAAWNQYTIHQESVQLALDRFEAVKQSSVLGDKPSIDTLEAYIQVQNRQMNQSQSMLAYKNATLELSNFLWYEHNTPLEITDQLHPPDFKEIRTMDKQRATNLTQALEQLLIHHPEIQLYHYQLGSMELTRRLKSEKLKPKIDLKYNVLSSDYSNQENYSLDNYKWGIEFSFPLFLRKQRGDIQLTKLKIEKTQLSQQNKILELQNKVKKYYNQQTTLEDQVALFSEAVVNYDLLLQGEKQKFDSGESSLFLVNSRETKLIEARLKLIGLISKYNIAQYGVEWATGTLYN